MDALRTFLVNNYLWFLIISLILIFALIGYLADAKRKEDEEEPEVKITREKKPKKTDEEQFLEENEAAMANISLNEAVQEKKINRPNEESKVEIVPETEEQVDDNVVTYDDSAINEEPKQ